MNRQSVSAVFARAHEAEQWGNIIMQMGVQCPCAVVATFEQVRERKVLTVDENALLVKAEEVARRCAARAGIALPAAQVMQVQSHA